MKRWITVLALSVAALGCIEEEVLHTLYLQPEGDLTWIADERQVRSGLDDPAERRREEREFLAAARVDRHPVAAALASFTPGSLVTTLVRERRPFHVVTRAELGPADRFAREVLFRLGAPGDAELHAAGDQRTLEVTLWPEEADDEALSEDDPLLALVADADDYRIVLAEGRFVAARGFEISASGAEARPLEDPADPPEGEALVLSLTWIVE